MTSVFRNPNEYNLKRLENTLFEYAKTDKDGGYFLLARYYFKLLSDDKARLYANKCLEENPNNRQAHYLLYKLDIIDEDFISAYKNLDIYQSMELVEVSDKTNYTIPLTMLGILNTMCGIKDNGAATAFLEFSDFFGSFKFYDEDTLDEYAKVYDSLNNRNFDELDLHLNNMKAICEDKEYPVDFGPLLTINDAIKKKIHSRGFIPKSSNSVKFYDTDEVFSKFNQLSFDEQLKMARFYSLNVNTGIGSKLFDQLMMNTTNSPKRRSNVKKEQIKVKSLLDKSKINRN